MLNSSPFARKDFKVGTVMAIQPVRALVMTIVLVVSANLAQGQSTVHVPADTQVRTTSFTYHPDGRVKTETVEPDHSGNSGLKLLTETSFPAVGITKVEFRGWDGAAEVARAASIDRGAGGRFAKVETNALGHAVKREFDVRFGLPTLIEDSNGVVTRIDYDGFGRKKQERRGYADRTAPGYTDRTDWTYERCADLNGGCASVHGVVPVTRVVETWVDSDDKQLAGVRYSYFDRLNREVRQAREVLHGGQRQFVYQDTVYDVQGKVSQVSNPYFALSQPVEWTKFEFDALGRVTRTTAPNGVVTVLGYSGLESTTTVHALEGARTRTTRTDARGLVEEVVDAHGRKMMWVHDAFGNRTHSVDAYGTTTHTQYDVRGRRKSLSDPDLGGIVSFTPNSFGEEAKVEDAAGRVNRRRYDSLGRLVSSSLADQTTTYTYDTATFGRGKLHQVSTDNGYCRTQGYDNLGRPTISHLGLGGQSPCLSPTSETMQTVTTYDTAGRVQGLTYPTGLHLRYSYDATLGFLSRVDNYTGNVPGPVYWQWQESDARGRLTKFLLPGAQTEKDYDPQTGWLRQIKSGTGDSAANADIQNSNYVYTSVGDLERRVDQFQLPGLQERSLHDKLGRLIQYARFDNTTGVQLAGTRVDIDYDAVGNIKSRSDVGTYYYQAPGAAAKLPHAVAEIRGAQNASFTYDPDTGNLLSGAYRSYKYSAANQVTEVSGDRACHRFIYQGEGLRVQQQVYDRNCPAAGTGGAGLVSTTFYMHPDAANGLAYERELRNGAYFHKHFVAVGGDVVAIVETQGGAVTSSEQGTTKVLFKDHLGSVVAIRNLASGAIERRAYDPWGAPRAADGKPTDTNLPGGLAPLSDRGFTMHEHLERLGLVHMNGRVYDPGVGRFVSPDPVVSAPDDMQGYNRFAYVTNRPLNSVDPTGLVEVSLSGFDAQTSWGLSGQTGSPLALGLQFCFGACGGAYSPGPNGFSGRGQAGAATQAYPYGMDYTQLTSLGDWGTTVDPKKDKIRTNAGGAVRTLAAKGGSLLDRADALLAQTRDNLVAAIPFIGADLYKQGAGDGLKVLDPFQGAVDATREAKGGHYAAAAIAGAGIVLKPLKGLGAAKGVTSLSPSSIRFSQSSVNGVDEIAASMRANGWKGAPIDVVRMSDGSLTTFDNTRLLAAQRAGIDVQATVRGATEAFPAGRWTPRSGVQPATWEDAVRARIQQQNGGFPSTYPNGSPYTGSTQ